MTGGINGQFVSLLVVLVALSGCTIAPTESALGNYASEEQPGGQTRAAADADLLIRDAILISPERTEAVHDVDVLVQQGQTREVAKDIEASPGVQVLDASGLYLTPGLIDSHVHLYHATGLKPGYTEDFDALYDAYVDRLPPSFLYFGYTSVIELNARPEANQRFSEASYHPRLFHCGEALVLDDGYFMLEAANEVDFAERHPNYLHVPGAGHPTPDGDHPANHTPERTVAVQIEDGVHCIKLHYEEARWFPGGPPPFRLPSQALIEDIVRAAHANGIPVVLHATTLSRASYGASCRSRHGGAWALGVAGRRP